MIELSATEVDQRGGNYCDTTLLRRELFGLANNNPAWRRGTLDYVAFQVNEGDRVDDWVERDSYIEIEYDFEAHRQRLPGDSPVVTFNFAVTASHHNILLPFHIAKQIDGCSYEDWRQEEQKAHFTSSLKFCFDTDSSSLETCESHIYLDEDGDEIHHACSCPDDGPEVMYVAPEAVFISEAQEDQDEDEPIDPELITASGAAQQTGVASQFPSFTTRARSLSEPYSQDDIQEALSLWENLQLLDDQLAYEMFDDQVATARVVLKRIQRSLLIMAGVDVRQLPSLR